MLEFETRKLEVKFNGDIHTVNLPNVKQMSEFSVKFKDTKNEIETIVGFLDTLGLKKDVSEQMEMGHVHKIIEALTTEKK